MTSENWAFCEDPVAMLAYLRGHSGSLPDATFWRTPTGWHPVASMRKLRLFATACCRAAWEYFPNEQRGLVEIAEVVADGYRDVMPDRPGNLMGKVVSLAAKRERDVGKAVVRASNAAACCHFDEMNAPLSLQSVLENTRNLNVKPATQATILHDIIGNPWKVWFETSAPIGQKPSYREMPSGHIPDAIAFYKAWRTPDVMSVAQAAYEDRKADGTLDGTRLAILADALTDAGCEEDALLWHLRLPVDLDHYRGCWALDLVLGKE